MSRAVKSAKGSKASSGIVRAAKPFPPAPGDFEKLFYANLLASDLKLFSAVERTRIAASMWGLAARRKPSETCLRVFNPAPDIDGWTVDHTVIEIVTADKPFLVASVTGVLQRAGYAVHMVIHPVMMIRRDKTGAVLGIGNPGDTDGVAESFIHVQIDHCLEGAQLMGIEADVRATLKDVQAAVEDWQPMRDRMIEASDRLDDPHYKKSAAGEDIGEVRAFLRWLCDDNFTFLGYREIDIEQKDETLSAIHIVPGRGLGILRDDETRMFGGLRDLDEKRRPALRKYVRQHHVLFVTKTNAVTRVHRVLPMDAVFIRTFDDNGTIVGEKLFVGLFTSKTYTQMPAEIPFMRHKIAEVVARMGFPAKSHDHRSLMHILNTYPHDELFQIHEDELYANARGILQLQERARVALFTRRDPFGRYVTCLVYVPRDRYDSALRARIQDFLEVAYSGKAQSWNVRIDDGRLARAFVTIHLTPDSLKPDPAQLENDLRDMCRTWGDRLRDSLVAAYGEASALALLRRYGDAFPQAYQDSISPIRAVQDVRELERVRAAPRFVATLHDAQDGRLILKLFQPGHALLLSEALPILENMGMKVDYMGGPYEIRFKDDAAPIYVHEFVGRSALPSLVAFDLVKTAFEESLAKVWCGEAESDAFNALTLRVGMEWRAVAVLRAFARYLRQLRIPYSHDMMAAAFLSYPQMAQQIYALFFLRHNPAFKGKREEAARLIEARIAEGMADITALEDDRIIRRYLNLVQSSLRTNLFQTDANGAPKSYISIKFDSHAVDFMPLPKPLYEIFVYSPQVEAVHLRGGKVARGGIRWSDRRDDFRAEILGLMKAQMVKNSVIVPVGSKGGFIVKRPPAEADKFQAEGIACYKVMMCGLLDITDNLSDGKIVPPHNVVRHDGDDPYLVVAADKGTATFSDIANGIAQQYGFWLDDAFASGGSAGYDHKAMGITARGAWEAVKRHFREIGKDTQKEDFTVIGVGDMSGDVFGNGMLLSEHILLQGAFDHRHVFCDPAPDAAASFAERKRLFALPRSSWADYDRKLISKGGGIFARSDKAVKISPEMKKAYGIAADTLTPAELIQAMLKAQVELLYFGGIGTYVKASEEGGDAVADRANDALRVNGCDLRAKIVCEGANLGMTQRGRVEYALKGGRLNTDAIDNSAGVDTSDHEVNIKVLLRRAVDRKKLTIPARNKVLAGMTKDVARLVLRDNYLQTQALSLAEARAAEIFPMHVRCIQELEKIGLLNRAVEFLPSDAEIAERQRLGRGLTRPELAVLFAYVKIWLYPHILDSSLPADPALRGDVADYFPKLLRESYAADIERHQLRREIAATVVTNDIINRTGVHAVLTMAMQDRVEPDAIVRAYLLARESFALPGLWAEIEALDAKVPADVQARLSLTVRVALVQAMRRLMADKNGPTHLDAAIRARRSGVAQLADWLGANRTASEDYLLRTVATWREQGVPESLARRVARFPILAGAIDLVDLAGKVKMPMGDLAGLFFGLEKRLDLAWLARLTVSPTGQTPWQRDAAVAALGELSGHHRRLTSQLAARMGKGRKANPLAAIDAWAEQYAAVLTPYDAMLAEWRATGGVDLAMLLLANARLATLSA
ncbi:MAG: NAD-glutamate dehydrogenase [Alphaproteobacteria bacterium]|nr:NAD-glutamate dehydrogenase [Alphaproteobacteria bacterium]